MQGEAPGEKQMRLRYAGTCRVCGVELPAKAVAIYERDSKTIRCVTHVDPAHGVAGSGLAVSVPVVAEVEVGTPGASARREFERRRTRREERIRTAHPRVGGLIHALSEEPQSTKAWDVGAIGEERLGRRLNELAGDQLLVLHDRRTPGSRANIDHLAVTPRGVYVIDAKRYQGRPHLKVEGGLLRPRVEKLFVGSRNCTSVVDGVLKQVQVVRELLEEPLPIHGVLCFVEAGWPLIGGSFTTRGVEVVSPRKLYSRLRSDGPLDAQAIDMVHRTIATALPPAYPWC